MERELTFRIVPLQKGKGSNYEVIQKQRSGGDDLRFEFTARVALGVNGAAPNLLGPFVQGPPGGRFVYIGIGAFVGQAGGWSRRLKVPLSGISSQMLNQIGNHAKLILETHVPGTGKDGGPTCATVRPFAGWKPVAS